MQCQSDTPRTTVWHRFLARPNALPQPKNPGADPRCGDTCDLCRPPSRRRGGARDPGRGACPEALPGGLSARGCCRSAGPVRACHVPESGEAAEAARARGAAAGGHLRVAALRCSCRRHGEKYNAMRIRGRHPGSSTDLPRFAVLARRRRRQGEGLASLPGLYHCSPSTTREDIDAARTRSCAHFFLEEGFLFVSVLRGGFVSLAAPGLSDGSSATRPTFVPRSAGPPGRPSPPLRASFLSGCRSRVFGETGAVDGPVSSGDSRGL